MGVYRTQSGQLIEADLQTETSPRNLRTLDRRTLVKSRLMAEALKALESAMDREFAPNFSPVSAVKKQIAAFLASGKMPTLR